MKLQVKRCRTCGALGVGPNAIKLWPFEGHMYCRDDYKDALHWDESRGNVTMGARFEDANARWAEKQRRKIGWLIVPLEPAQVGIQQWRGYIAELSGMASWALLVGDRRTFVYYFSRAVWAWALKEGA